MERYTMFLYWNSQYCENDYITQSNLQIQCNSYEIANDLFMIKVLEQKKIANGLFVKKVLEQKNSQFVQKHNRLPKKSWERKKQLEESTFLTSDYTAKLQSSRQYGVITKIEVYRNIEQWNKIENPEINSCTLFLTVGARI